MKKQLFIIPLIFILSSCEQQEATHKPEEIIKQEIVPAQEEGREVKQSQLNVKNKAFYVGDEETPYTGNFTGIHKNGQLRTEGSFVNGRRNGLLRNWYEDGQLKSEGTFVNGKQNGLFRKWDKNGQLTSEKTFVNGKLTN